MTLHAGWFAVGALLLLFPADRLLSSLVRLRTFGSFQGLENSPRFRPWWWVPALWLDPLRGFAGAYFAQHAIAASLDWEAIEKVPYALVVALLCLGVLFQLFTRLDREALLAPIGFVIGIVVALTPWTVSLIGMTMALTAMFAFRHFQAFFAVGVAIIGILGVVLGAPPLWLVPSLVVVALPLALSVVTGRSLELPVRDGSGARASAESRAS